MRSCDFCAREITALTGSVQLRTDQWQGKPRPVVNVEFYCWKHCVSWILKNKDELLAAKALPEIDRPSLGRGFEEVA